MASQGRAFGDLGAWGTGLPWVRQSCCRSQQAVSLLLCPACPLLRHLRAGGGLWGHGGGWGSKAWLEALPLTDCKPVPLGLGASSVPWLLSKVPSGSEPVSRRAQGAEGLDAEPWAGWSGQEAGAGDANYKPKRTQCRPVSPHALSWERVPKPSSASSAPPASCPFALVRKGLGATSHDSLPLPVLATFSSRLD